MILVTLGTQKQPFTRLLDMVEKISTKEKIIVQAGHTKYESKKMEIFDFVDYETMDKLIDEANLKGYTIGGAQVSEKHAGFIINKGNATAKDILELIEYVKEKVYETSKEKIDLEVEIVGEK